MKKALFFTVLLLSVCYSSINAQTEKGNWLVGASSGFNLAANGSGMMSLGYSTSKTKSDAGGDEGNPDKILSFNVLPSIGYFLFDNFAAGLDVNVAYSRNVDGGTEIISTQSLVNAGPFLRYYLTSSRVKPYLELGGTYGLMTAKISYANYTSDNSYGYDSYTPDDREMDYDMFTLRACAGASVMLSKKTALDISAGYNTYIAREKTDNEDNERSILNNIGLKIGIVVFLGS